MDADALWMLYDLKKEDPKFKSLKGFLEPVSQKNTVILTPNGIEMTRLLQRYVDPHVKPELVADIAKEMLKGCEGETMLVFSKAEALESSPNIKLFFDLLEGLPNVTLVVKGLVDIIISKEQVGVVAYTGGLKRCGGQGDILTGLISLYAQWSYDFDKSVLRGIMLASIITRHSSYLAFKKHLLSLTSKKILDELPQAMRDILELSAESFYGDD